MIMLTLFRIGFLRAAHFLSPLPLNKIRHTYPTMMKLGTIIPKGDPKMYKSRDTSVDFC